MSITTIGIVSFCFYVVFQMWSALTMSAPTKAAGQYVLFGLLAIWLIVLLVHGGTLFPR